jgi:hypothetical protein
MFVTMLQDHIGLGLGLELGLGLGLQLRLGFGSEIVYCFTHLSCTEEWNFKFSLK